LLQQPLGNDFAVLVFRAEGEAQVTMHLIRQDHRMFCSGRLSAIQWIVVTAMPLLLLAAVTSCVTGEKPPATILPVITATLPRDSTAFTQGLFCHEGRLYESHGLYGHSGLLVIDAKNGSTLKQIDCAPEIFAEGCTEFNGAMIQLTWREQTAYVYGLPDLDKRNTLTYAGEGWGLTSDGTRLYMSDGSDTITVRSNDFTIVKKLPVHAGGMPVNRLNELEWVRGELYANIWYSDKIVAIDPKSGRALRFIDCAELIRREQPRSEDHVLNGIAFDPATGLLYLTGKKWRNIYLVKVGSDK
jgi:glutamine cyclotransferase